MKTLKNLPAYEFKMTYKTIAGVAHNPVKIIYTDNIKRYTNQMISIRQRQGFVEVGATAKKL